MSKSNLKLKARELRSGGESIKTVARLLGVSSSTVSYWCRDIVLTREQLKVLEKKYRDPYYGKRQEYLEKVKKETERKSKEFLNLGTKEVGNISKRELFLIGSTLYWAEGFKKDSQVGFANSDPKMISIFMKWLYDYFGYQKDDLILRVTANISHKIRIKEIEKYWANVTGVAIENFRKPFFQNFKWKKVYENPNEYYGLLRIKVRKSKDFLRKILGFIEGLRLNANLR